MTNTNNQPLENLINLAWDDRANINQQNVTSELKNAVASVIDGLNNGSLRVATRISVGNWTVNQWVKKAVLLSFKLQDNEVMPAGGFTQFYDKVPSKFADYTAADFAAGGFRVVPPAIARRG